MDCPCPGPCAGARRSRAAAGFTLIELLIVLAIVGILSAVAYPAYQAHVLRTHRGTAAACLQELAMQMERRYTTRMSYQPAASQPALPAAPCVGTAGGRYAFAQGPVGTAPGPTDDDYLLQATPQGAQLRDTACGTLGLDQRGTRTRSGTAPDVQSCWR